MSLRILNETYLNRYYGNHGMSCKTLEDAKRLNKNLGGCNYVTKLVDYDYCDVEYGGKPKKGAVKKVVGYLVTIKK